MPLVHVKKNYQITIPLKLRNALQIKEGDVMQAEIEGDIIILKPKSLVDKIELNRQKWVKELIETGIKNPVKESEENILSSCKNIRKKIHKEIYGEDKK